MNALDLSLLAPDLSPPPVLTILKPGDKKTIVVRDDLLPGGTKQRASAPFIEDMISLGFDHFIYASPFAGFAQVALAYVCQILKVKCTIMAERDQRFTDNRFHPFSLMARNFGAKLVMATSLPEAEELATNVSLHQSRKLKIPLGFACPEFRFHLKEEVSKAFTHIGPVKNLWMPVGSGTLVRTFLTALPDVQFKCVNVNVLNSKDPRINFIQNHPQVTYFEAPMSFHTEATDYPTIPSNSFYDAKIWAFIKEHGEDGDVWWNVAK